MGRQRPTLTAAFFRSTQPLAAISRAVATCCGLPITEVFSPAQGSVSGGSKWPCLRYQKEGNANR